MLTTQRFACLALVCLGCSAQTLEVGTNDGGTSPRSDGGTDPATGTTQPGQGGAPASQGTAPPGSMLTGSAASALVGKWTGYVESYSFASGSDSLALTFTQDASGAVEGTVVFGQGQPPPPATDGNVGYPPNFLDVQLLKSPLLDGNPFEGFAYQGADMSFDGTRLKAGVFLSALWDGWCALQTPYGQGLDGGGPGYACLPNWGSGEDSEGCRQTDPSTEARVPVDCGKLVLCGPSSSVCACTATACSADMRLSPSISFDMQLMGNRIDGSTVLSGQVHNVHLTRSP